jgi:hypothetical protein
MQRTVIVIAVVVVLVGFLGFIVLPWLRTKLFGEANSVTLNILTACVDNDVEVPGAKGTTVSKIVAEVEIAFPYGTAPDSISDLTVRDDNNEVVDVNWGRMEPEKRDIESKGKTTLILREAFFPTDFKQGKLIYKNDKYLCYFRMPAVTPQ